jgi:alkyl sulfatase BDS1-like metallo-beta-lactamase superfamily hydrolase
MLAGQRDNYRYLHDQTVRLMNQGLVQTEIAEELKQPKALADQWYNRGYYGTYSHNSKAVYQFYLGWYDANPANLNPWPPVERARRSIAAMGGAGKVIALAQKAMREGDYRWSSDLLSQLVFAQPANPQARALLADSFEQQAYQAESAIWRNQFLGAANDLRKGYKPNAFSNQGADMISAVATQTLLDSVATRFDPARLAGRKLGVNLVMPERQEVAGIELTGTTMVPRMTGLSRADATITAPRRVILGMLFMKLPLDQLEMAGLKVEGDRAAAQAWLDAIDPLRGGFNIAEP